MLLLPLVRPFLLFLCTTASFVVLGRAPGAVNLRTRDLEVMVAFDGKAGRDKRPAIIWSSGAGPT